MKIGNTRIKKILVTGGAGFIGANFVRYVHRHFPEVEQVNLDKLTYAGNLENLAGIDTRYTFIHGDIRDPKAVAQALSGVEAVINFAAETHVDRSIHSPGEFILTDVYGVFVLLEEIRRISSVRLFVHISTDEVYGSIPEGTFTEESPLNPSSPYAASKAGGDRLAYSYFKTYGIPLAIIRPSNNYGPYQYPEKLIPFFITRILAGESLPLYGDGSNRRDWLFVEDAVRGILKVMEKGKVGEVYNMGAGQERTNLEVSRKLLSLLGKPESLIRFITDRKGHDLRYALQWNRLHALGWQPQIDFDRGLEMTVKWYLQNRGWWEKVISQRDYQRHLEKNYG